MQPVKIYLYKSQIRSRLGLCNKESRLCWCFLLPHYDVCSAGSRYSASLRGQLVTVTALLPMTLILFLRRWRHWKKEAAPALNILVATAELLLAKSLMAAALELRLSEGFFLREAQHVIILAVLRKLLSEFTYTCICFQYYCENLSCPSGMFYTLLAKMPFISELDSWILNFLTFFPNCKSSAPLENGIFIKWTQINYSSDTKLFPSFYDEEMNVNILLKVWKKVKWINLRLSMSRQQRMLCGVLIASTQWKWRCLHQYQIQIESRPTCSEPMCFILQTLERAILVPH